MMRAFFLTLLIAFGFFPEEAWSQARRRTDAREDIAAVVYASQATQAASERRHDERIRELREEIDRRTAEGARSARRLAEAQERFVRELAARDRAYEAQIAVFRDAVRDIASTPEGAAALARYRTGDEVGALAIMDDLVEADARARQRRTDFETAEQFRANAVLAAESYSRDNVTVDQMIERFERINRLDPDQPDDLLSLASYYYEAGRLGDSERLARQILSLPAINETNRGDAIRLLADLLLVRGDIAAAGALLAPEIEALERRVAAMNATEVLNSNAASELNEMRRFWVFVKMDEGNWIEARRVLLRMLPEHNDMTGYEDKQTLAALADVSWELGDLEGAERYYLRALDATGTSWHWETMEDGEAQGDPVEAAEFTELTIALGNLAMLRGRLEDAQRYYTDGLEPFDHELNLALEAHFSDELVTLISLGALVGVYSGQADLAQARGEFTLAQSLRQRVLAALAAQPSLRREDFEFALIEADAILELAYGHAAAGERGQLRLVLDEVLARSRVAEQRDGDNPLRSIEVSGALLAMGELMTPHDPRQGLAWLTEALAINTQNMARKPGDYQLRLERGAILLARGEAERALPSERAAAANSFRQGLAAIDGLDPPGQRSLSVTTLDLALNFRLAQATGDSAHMARVRDAYRRRMATLPAPLDGGGVVQARWRELAAAAQR